MFNLQDMYTYWGFSQGEIKAVEALKADPPICPFHNKPTKLSIGWYHYKIECSDCLRLDTPGGYNNYNKVRISVERI